MATGLVVSIYSIFVGVETRDVYILQVHFHLNMSTKNTKKAKETSQRNPRMLFTRFPRKYVNATRGVTGITSRSDGQEARSAPAPSGDAHRTGPKRAVRYPRTMKTS